MATLVSAGLVYLNLQAVFSSAAVVVPKKDSYRMVGDFRAVNSQHESVPGPTPRKEEQMSRTHGATHFCSLDLLHAHWQMPLTEEAQEMFTISTPDGLLTPTRVPQGVLNATSYFQGQMSE